MKAVIIHAAKDLRVEQRSAAEPGTGQVGITIGAGGICGSDLHYYNHGGFGAVRVRHPMVLGHEVAGTVTAIGPDVKNLAVGDKVAVSPSLPCNQCEYCLAGQQNHCLDMRYYGSAMRNPHVDGAFQQQLVAEARQCHKLAEGISLVEGAFAEPFAVTLHAIRRAGSLLGKRVLITGCGPIGALCVIAARAHGASEIIITDVLDAPLTFAPKVGADRTINVADAPESLAALASGKGSVDVMFEASGNAAAFTSALSVLRPRSILVQLGMGEDVPLPLSVLVGKEIDIRGSFRFHEEFALAVDLINRRRVDVMPLLSDTLPIEDAVAAFELASDRSRSMKVQLAL
ncbi:L-idonate 5-dehydrogenase [Devosia rhodophyticola]|uniref:L-idonate 5-dehydrogenase n=1 Tax=Devosia rhodophyticola TaxID=3026423 RepID=A0ABY7YTS9_9HYPH|nr:L-idonate 5-dehydrogenase [Devosia rhodophyticola]WDR04654.1 L-idonate 5-dehydrogenase [Devosia rhodophyticola]